MHTLCSFSSATPPLSTAAMAGDRSSSRNSGVFGRTRGAGNEAERRVFRPRSRLGDSALHHPEVGREIAKCKLETRRILTKGGFARTREEFSTAFRVPCTEY